MKLDISEQERAFLLELLAAKDTAMYHELHHTDAREYKEYVRRRIELLEELKSRVELTSSSSDVAA